MVEMGSNNPIININLVNLGKISEVAKDLIDKISEAVGGLFKPYQTIRVAKAEAEADLIRAESQIQVTDLHRRAFRRFLEEEAKKQKNIEEITRQALPYLEEKAKPKKVEDDWITNFFDKCRLISDSEMQSLWSRVLAGEANSPGSYSKRTVNFLSSLDKSDAKLFTNLCTFVWMIGKNITPIIYDFKAKIYEKHGISFDSLTHLDSIGLVHFDNWQSMTLMKLPRKLTALYHEKPTTLELNKDSDNDITVGHVILTRIGSELAPICGSQPDPEFQEYVITKWKGMGYIKEEKTEQPAPPDVA